MDARTPLRTAPAGLTVLLLVAMSVACSSAPEPSTDVAFEVRGVVAEVESGTAEPLREETIVRADAPGSSTDGGLELGPAFVSARHLASAVAVQGDTEFWSIEVTLDADGDARLRTLTGLAACMSEEARTGRIAVLVDDEVVSSPMVSVPCGSDIGSPLRITGDFSEEEASELAEFLD